METVASAVRLARIINVGEVLADRGHANAESLGDGLLRHPEDLLAEEHPDLLVPVRAPVEDDRVCGRGVAIETAHRAASSLELRRRSCSRKARASTECAACGCVQSSIDEFEFYILGDDRVGRLVPGVRGRSVAIARARLHRATLARVPQARQRRPNRDFPSTIEKLTLSLGGQLVQTRELRHTRSA